MRKSSYEHIERELFSVQEDYINKLKGELEDINDRILKDLKESIEKAQKELNQLNLGNVKKILEETINECITELEEQIERVLEDLDNVNTKIEGIKEYIHSLHF